MIRFPLERSGGGLRVDAGTSADVEADRTPDPAPTARDAKPSAGTGLDELLARWELEQETLRRRRARGDLAALLADVLSDFRTAIATEREAPLTYEQAAVLCHYTRDHLTRLVREGKLENVGRKGAPRLRRRDVLALPRARARRAVDGVAAGSGAGYDAAAEVRSYERRRRGVDR